MSFTIQLAKNYNQHLLLLLCDFLFDSNIQQLIQEPTHVHGNILDLIIINNDSTVLQPVTVHKIDHFRVQSDHSVITFSLAVPLPSYCTTKNSQQAFLITKKLTGIRSLNLFFSQALFSQNTVFHDVETCWKYLKSLIAERLELFVPKMHIHASSIHVGSHQNWSIN